MFFICLSFMAFYGSALNQPGNITPHSNARCSVRHLGLGLGGKNFCSNLMEKIENVVNPSLVRVPQRGMVYFSCIALCENTLKQIGNNTHPSRALRHLGGSFPRYSLLHLGGSLCGESICWKPLEETGNVEWWYRIFISLFLLGFSYGFIACMTYSNKNIERQPLLSGHGDECIG